MIKRATILRMSWTVDFANGTDIPLAIDANVAKMMALEAGFRIAWVVTVKRSIYRYWRGKRQGRGGYVAVGLECRFG